MQFPNVPGSTSAPLTPERARSLVLRRAAGLLASEAMEDGAFFWFDGEAGRQRPARERNMLRSAVEDLAARLDAEADEMEPPPARDTMPSGEMAVVVDLSEEGEDSGVHRSTMLPPAYLATIGGAS